MAVIELIAGLAGLFVAGFLAWSALWHFRVRNAFEKVPVSTGRSAYALRRGVVIPNRHPTD